MKKSIIWMLVIVLIMSGCSITQINDNIMDAVSGEDKVMQIEDQADLATIVEDENMSESKNEDNTESQESNNETDTDLQRIDNKNVIIRGIGESFPGFLKYDEKLFDGTIERKTVGTEGVTYTLNSINIYESIEESGITPNESILDQDGSINKYILMFDEYADFIVAEMSATYNAPEGGEETVTVYTSSDFFIDYFEDKLLEGFEDRRTVVNKENVKINNIPGYHWFETDEAHRVESELEWGKNSYNFIISDGETVSFRIGVIASRELIETENVYLCINMLTPGFIKDYNYKYFALFPEE